MSEEYSGVQKAAILLITLGPEKAATIFQHLKEEEIEELTLEIANTRSVSPQDKEAVLDEFYQVCLAEMCKCFIISLIYRRGEPIWQESITSQPVRP